MASRVSLSSSEVFIGFEYDALGDRYQPEFDRYSPGSAATCSAGGVASPQIAGITVE